MCLKKVVNWFLLIVMAVLLASCGGADERKQKYFAKAEQYIAEGNLDKAKIELKNVLQIDPKFSKAYYLSGVVEEKNKRWRKALGNYAKAVELDPENIDASVKLGGFYLLQSKEDKAVELLNKLKKMDANHYKVRFFDATLLSRHKNEQGDKKAELLLRNIISEQPQFDEAAAMLAGMYLRSENSGEAIKVLKAAAKVNPKNIKLRGLLVRIYASRNELDEAEKNLIEIKDIKEGDYKHIVNLARFYVRTDNADKATKVLDEAIKAEPDETERYYVYAEFLALKKGTKEAEKFLIDAAKTHKHQDKLKLLLGKLYEKNSQHDDAVNTYLSIVEGDKFSPDGLAAMNNLANIFMNKGDIKKAEGYVSEILTETPANLRAQLTKGKIALINKDAVTAVNSLRVYLKEQPDVIGVYALLAKAHLINEEPQLAKEIIQRAVDLNPKNPKAHVLLAKTYLSDKALDEGLKEVDIALELNPKEFEALMLKANILAFKKEVDSAEGVLKSVKEFYPENSVSYNQLGGLYFVQKKYEKAISEFEQGYDKTKEKATFLKQIVKTLLSNKKTGKAVARINKAINQSPDDPVPLELLSQIYIQEKNYDAAKKTINKALSISEDAAILHSRLSQIHQLSGQSDMAENALINGIQKVTDDSGLKFQLATLYEKNGKRNKAVQTYREILESYPDMLSAVNNLAVLISDSDTQQALALATRLENSNKPVYLDTLAWVHYKAKNYEQALSFMTKVIDKAPDVPVFAYHIGEIYKALDNKEKALKYLKQAVDSEYKFDEKDDAIKAYEMLK